METTRTKEAYPSLRPMAAALTIVSAALNWASSNASAEERPAALQPPEEHSVGLPNLESAFWICDHAATTRVVDMNEGVVCTAISERLKNEKFGGDFDAMLLWWQQNKVTKHRPLEAGRP